MADYSYEYSTKEKREIAERSECKNGCKSKLKAFSVALEQVPENIRKLIVQRNLKYVAMSCPKCGSNGLSFG